MSPMMMRLYDDNGRPSARPGKLLGGEACIRVSKVCDYLMVRNIGKKNKV